MKKIRISRCKKGENWLPLSETFFKFAENKKFMHEFLYNGDDLWPKHVNLCALGRNTLLDTAFGPGTARNLGLFGTAWDSNIFSVAWTNNFSKSLYIKDGSKIVYSWPVFSTVQIHLLSDIQKYIETKNSGFFPVKYKLPASFQKTAKNTWKTQNIEIEWAKRLRGALINLMFVKLQNFPSSGLFKNKNLFFKEFQNSAPAKRGFLLKKFIKDLKSFAKQKNILYPSYEISSQIKKLIYTKSKYWPELSPLQLRLLVKKDKRFNTPEYKLRLKKINYITTGKTGDYCDLEEEIPTGWKKSAEKYHILKKREQYWKNRLKNIVKSEENSKKIEKIIKRYELLLTGNFYFQTTHLSESSSGYTHAAMLLYLDNLKKHWMFERVVGFYYANPLHKFKHSAIAELMVPSYKIISRPACYKTISYKIRTPFIFKRGASDKITWINIFSDLKSRLAPGYELGFGFIYGAMNLILKLPENFRIMENLIKYKKRGAFVYADYPDLQSLKNKTIKLLIRYKQNSIPKSE